MQKGQPFLRGLLYVAGAIYAVSAVATLIDVQWSLGSAGVVVLTATEAGELTAVYGGLFIVMAALCHFARERLHDTEFVAFVGFSFLIVAAARLYAAFRHGWPESPRTYGEFTWEVVVGCAILFLNGRVEKEKKSDMS